MSSSTTPTPTYDQIHALLTQSSQTHLLQFYPTLNADDQRKLLDQLSQIDFPRVNRIYRDAIHAESTASATASHNPTSSSGETDLQPLPATEMASTIPPHSSPASIDRWTSLGLTAIRQGQVGIILMAGGQGTRLGSSAPKGCYDIGLPSGKSLFRMQGERIGKLNELARASAAGGEEGEKRGGKLVWYVMTSGPTRKETERYFKENDWFGLDEEDVVFFDQGVLPALTDDGKIFLQDKSTVSVAPDGNGGLYAALRRPLPDSPHPGSSVLDHMKSRGIRHLHAYCVDNCLVRVADPVFLGYSIERGAETGAKVVKKRYAGESVGVLALRGGKYHVVEYSEMGQKECEALDDQGELAFRQANIANHYFTLDFLLGMEAMEQRMTFHIARKKITHVDLATGQLIKPSQPNGMKLELFVFDVFPFTSKLAVLEVPREEEFSPLKNAPGSATDGPETSRRDILAQHKAWLKAAGAEVGGDEVEVEIDPRVSYAGEGLEAFRGKKITKSLIVDSVEVAQRL